MLFLYDPQIKCQSLEWKLKSISQTQKFNLDKENQRIKAGIFLFADILPMNSLSE